MPDREGITVKAKDVAGLMAQVRDKGRPYHELRYVRGAEEAASRWPLVRQARASLAAEADGEQLP